MHGCMQLEPALRSKPDPLCPLFKALCSKIGDTSVIAEEVLGELREDVIPGWGVPSPWTDLETRHAMQREHIRKELVKNRQSQAVSDRTVSSSFGACDTFRHQKPKKGQ